MTDDIDNEFIKVTQDFVIISRTDATVIAVYFLGVALGLYIGLRWGHGA